MSIEMLKKMIVLKKINFDKGMITIFGRTVAFMPIEVMLQMHERLDKEMGKQKADEIMYDMGYYQTKSGSTKYMKQKNDMARIYTKLSNTGDPAMEMGRDVLKFTGWGDHQIMEMTPDGKKMIIKTVISPVANEYLKTRGKSKAPVCHYISGILAGVAGAVRDGEYDCKETSCAATGLSANCIFELTKRA